MASLHRVAVSDRKRAAVRASVTLRARAAAEVQRSVADLAVAAGHLDVAVTTRDRLRASLQRIGRERVQREPDPLAACLVSALADLALGAPGGGIVRVPGDPPAAASAITGLSVEVLDAGSDVLVALHGELDRSTVGTFMARIGQVGDRFDGFMVLDMSRLDFMDVAGAHAVWQLGIRRPDRLKVRQPRAIVARLLALRGMESLIA